MIRINPCLFQHFLNNPAFPEQTAKANSTRTEQTPNRDFPFFIS